jgi:protein-L-isoaspartate O-methyltransferase
MSIPSSCVNLCPQQARSVLQRLGYANVTVFAGDGAQGLPQYAPFHAVVCPLLLRGGP